jgi:tetraprenyl-beta-curcumene synthase
MPLSARQVWALVTAATRELLWGLRAVSREMHRWQRHALTIPDAPIREGALASLARKRTHADGAALFWILPRRRDLRLLRLLVAYEVILDFLDNVSERGVAVGATDGRQLHLALSDAMDLGGPISDYYRDHPWRDDGGYLRALVETCRASCVSLPSYPRVRDLVIREATRAQVLALNHYPDPEHRDTELRRWAAQEYPRSSEASWFELTSAASASLTIHALLVLAAEAECSEEDIAATYAAYFPWISTTSTMLDSYVDQAEDAASGGHSYIEHYLDSQNAIGRLGDLIRKSTYEASRLRNGHRHAVIVACMVAMYLSKDSARAPAMRARTSSLAEAGGSLTRLLLPILRLWRIVYRQRSA